MTQESDSATFTTFIGISHLDRALGALEEGKQEIADTHFQRAGDALTDSLVALYPDIAYQSGDLFVIHQQRQARKSLPHFTAS